MFGLFKGKKGTCLIASLKSNREVHSQETPVTCRPAERREADNATPTDGYYAKSTIEGSGVLPCIRWEREREREKWGGGKGLF